MASADILISANTRTLDKSKNTSSNFSLQFDQPIILPTLNYYISLISLSAWNSVHNFNNLKNFNTSYTINGATVVSLVDGVYSFEDWLAAVESAYGGPLPMKFSVNYNTGKFLLTFPSGGSFRARNRFWQQLGFQDWFDESIDPYGETTYSSLIGSSFTPQWNLGVTAYNLTCDLTNSSRSNSAKGNVIASFVPESSKPYSHIHFKPNLRTHQQVNKTAIQSINFTITDDEGNILDFNGEDVSLLLAIQKGMTR